LRLNEDTHMLFILTALLFGYNLFSNPPAQQPGQPRMFTGLSHRIFGPQSQGKKILILYSDGGSCHKSATQAIKERLAGSPYQIATVNFFEEIAQEIDPVKALTLGYMSGEDIYNKMLRRGWNSLVNYMALKIAPVLIKWSDEDLKNLSKEYFKQSEADIIISTIPIINHGAAIAAQELGIPYILLTLDCELATWLLDFDQPDFYEKMYITVWYDNQKIRERLAQYFVPEENIRCLGFPVRKQFFEKKDVAELKKKYSIPPDKFVVMLMMGGNGNIGVYRYAKRLMGLDIPVHIIACTGKNDRLARRVKRLKAREKEPVSLTVLEFTPNISDIMALSDLLVTKPGPGTINESLLFELPVLIDAGGTPLFWEKPHIDFIKDNNYGASFTDIDELEALVREYAQTSRSERHAIYHNKEAIAPVLSTKKLVNLIEEALSNSEESLIS